MERRLSRPWSVLLSTGTPRTGRRVMAAAMPGTCAAPPAPAAITRRTDNPDKPEASDQDAREALSRLTDENALLRAALAEARARLGEAEENAGRDPLTALHDPRQFRAELERVLSQAARHGTPAAL